MRPAITLLTMLALSACDDMTPEPGPELDGSTSTNLLDASADANIAVEQKRELNASSMEAWVYLDLESGETRADGSGWSAWDLKAQRFNLATNGGISGSGSVLASVLTSGSFAALTKAPVEGWSADATGSDGKPAYVISTGDLGWWNYDETTHALSPKPYVYAVRSQEGAFFKLAIEGYYNAAGSGGYLQLHWAPISAPDGAIVPRDPNAQKPDSGVDGMTSASKM